MEYRENRPRALNELSKEELKLLPGVAEEIARIEKDGGELTSIYAQSDHEISIGYLDASKKNVYVAILIRTAGNQFALKETKLWSFLFEGEFHFVNEIPVTKETPEKSIDCFSQLVDLPRSSSANKRDEFFSRIFEEFNPGNGYNLK